jgi:hypothetical protein
MKQEGSVSDDARGIAFGVGRRGELELLDDEVAVRGVTQQPAQGMEAAGVAGLKRIALAGDDGGRGARSCPPGHAERVRDPRSGRVTLADLLEGPLPGPFGQHRPRRDRLVLLGPRPDLAGRVRAAPDPLPPAQQHRTATDWQVPHPARASVLRPRHRAAVRAAHQIGGGLHQQLKLSADVRRGQDVEPGQPEQGSAQRRRIVIQPGASHARNRLVVITNREGPGPYLSSPAQRRRVGTRARVPGSIRRATLLNLRPHEQPGPVAPGLHERDRMTVDT